ncbi:MAG: HAD family hydrolase [Lentisphaeria bacterium]|nr:HAD family hydrolase [Lentisphaeria bacterium]
MKKIKISRILMDIDGTMTWYTGVRARSNLMLQILAEMLMEQYGTDKETAMERILNCGDTATQCLSEFLPSLNISAEKYFAAVRDELSESIYIPEDTKIFLEKMKEAGIPVCTATTNSIFATRIKLAVGGLADIDGSPYISGYHPGCEFGDPEGKFSAHYFPAILEKHKYAPETLMMIGDEVEHDFYPALKAGIRYGVVIDRKQKERLIAKDGGIFISDLRVLLDLLEI